MITVNDRVYISFDLAGVPVGTLGTVLGFCRGVPQIDLGPHGIRNVAPHAVVRVELPDGAPELPEDGEVLRIEDLLEVMAGLSWDLHALQQRVYALARRHVVFGRC